jgi:hypothetical protein
MAGDRVFIMRVFIMKRVDYLTLYVLFLLLISAIYPAAAYAEPPHGARNGARVEMFSPQGLAKDVRQVSARFSEPMVTFGQADREAPFVVKCSEHGTGRWVDVRTWVYDFDRDMPGGIVCSFKLKDGFKTLAGNTLAASALAASAESLREFSFNTGGPAVTGTTPYEGMTIDDDQAFILYTDAEVDENSVVENTSCVADGINERVGVRILKGADRDAIIKAAGRDYYAERGRTLLLLQCKRTLPADRAVRLVWGKGVKSKSGLASGKEQVFSFKVRPAFTVMFSCARENPQAACMPLGSMSLRFSAPIAKEQMERMKLTGNGKTYPQRVFKDEDYADTATVEFPGPFPENSDFTLEIPSDVTDDAGRRLKNASAFPLAVKTAGYPPLAKFSARFGIIEKDDPVLPVTFRNVEPEVAARLMGVAVNEKKPVLKALLDSFSGSASAKLVRAGHDMEIIRLLREISTVGRSRSILSREAGAEGFSVPRPGGGADPAQGGGADPAQGDKAGRGDRGFRNAFEVVGIPLKNPGLYVVELESPALGKALMGVDKSMYVVTSALVTGLAAHLKLGRDSSLVWVTRLDNGKPVSGASVVVRNCTGDALWEGKTDARGVAYISNQLHTQGDESCRNLKRDPDSYMDSSQMAALDGITSGFFVFVRTKDDMTFVHSSWNNGIENWRFQLPEHYVESRYAVHTVFDRTLLRAGETVHMKHFLRGMTMAGLQYLTKDDAPDKVRIDHRGSKQTYEFPVKWDHQTGTAEVQWAIPRDAKLGAYAVSLLKNTPFKGKSYNRNELDAGEFRVEEFRVPLMKAAISPVSGNPVNAAEVEFDVQASYLSGGGAAGLPVKLRGSVDKKFVYFKDYENFSFAQGDVKIGLERGGGNRESQGEEPDSEAAVAGDNASRHTIIPSGQIQLGPGGALRTSLSGIAKTSYPQELRAEAEYADPNGERQSVSTAVTVWPSAIALGIRPDSWALSKDALKFQVQALGVNGKPAANIAVETDLLERKTYSHRKRIIGGFYSYEHTSEIRPVKTLCAGRTDSAGILTCQAASPVSGSLIIRASAKDSAQNPSVTHSDVWVSGKDDWWYEVSDSDRIDILPEKKRYEPGQTARFQVRMPFKEATALVTVEREGVIDVFVKTISRKSPVIEIPIKGGYAPNVFVSVLCVRGRSGDVKPAASIDLGRPAFKLGIAEILVGWRANELKVEVKPERETYGVRGKVKVAIRVKRADGSAPGQKGEAAVAVVDAGLLELAPNNSWQLLEAMMQMHTYDVETATAQSQVVGKRHYGLKAVPPGGGGGNLTMRELFDTLIYWNPRVKFDADGRADIEFTLGDSLTAFKIAAVAHSGASLFGSGYAEISTTQDLMLLSGLPLLVREGDRYDAGFTIRNASRRTINAEVTAFVESGSDFKKLAPVEVKLKAGQAREISWPVDVPRGGESGESRQGAKGAKNDFPRGPETVKWKVVAVEKVASGAEAAKASGKISGKASGKVSGDSMKITQKIAQAVPVRVWQSTLAQLHGSMSVPVEIPKDAIKGTGGLSVSLRPKISDDTVSVRDYMRSYPYSCLEQRVSRAVALDDADMWKKIVAELPAYADSDGLLKYFPSAQYGSDVLSSYLLSISAAAGFEFPEGRRAAIEDALVKFVEGKTVRHAQALPTADLALRKLSAVEALSKVGRFDPKMLASISIDPELWPTSAVLDWINILTRGKTVPERNKRLPEAMHVLRSRLNLHGTAMGFSTEKSDNLWWLMTSADVNAVKTILTLMDSQEWKEDMPRIVSGAMGRRHLGRWNTTVANAWGAVALRNFSKKFEAEAVHGASSASLGEARHEVNWQITPAGVQMLLDWPGAKADVNIRHEGAGNPWVVLQSLAAIPLIKPVSSGYKISRTVTPVEQREKDKYSVGDILRIKIEVDAQADMTWVVVNDPVPSGASIIGTGLGGDSRLAAAGQKSTGAVWPVFQERSFEALKAYYEFVPKGKFSMEYTVRLNNSGIFKMPETRVEALYAPEAFGMTPNEDFRIGK